MSDETQSAGAENASEATAGGTGTTVADSAESVATEVVESAGAEQPAEEGSLIETAQGQTDEAKAEGQEEAEEQKDEEKDAEGAPESYESFTAPEGITLDEGMTNAFSEVAKDLNLSQKQAQSVIDRLTPVMAQRGLEQIKAVSAEWVQKTKTDKEIGGTNLSRTLSDVARIRDRFGRGADGQIDPDVLDFIQSPMGNHPGAIKLLARAGRAFGEGSFPTGKPEGRQLTANDVYKNSIRRK